MELGLISGKYPVGKLEHPKTGRRATRIMIEIEDLYELEWVDWFRMTPQERWEESAKLWHHYISMGGSLDSEPDLQSPFYDPETSGRPPVDGRPGLRVIRRSGV
jgi:hypothetical protein